jgi:peptide/nickel transport system substrate-binding protein
MATRAPLIPSGGMSRSQFMKLTAVGAAAAMGLPALAPDVVGAASASAPTRGGSIRLGNTADITTFEPYVVGDNATIWNLTLIYDQLTRPSKDAQSVEPSLAQSWDVSKDGLTYTFHLRKGIKFHDGSPLTAADVAFCINQAAYAKNSIWGFLFGDFKTMEAIDDHTVRAHLANPHAPFLADMALFACSIYPKKLAGKALWSHPVGTGPFMFQSWTKGTELVLARNPSWWRNSSQPYIDTFHNMVVPDGNTRALQVQSGELDIAVYVPPSIAIGLKSNPAVVVHIDPYIESVFITMNVSVTNPPLNNKLVRQARNYAVDKNTIVNNILFGTAKASGQALPPMLGYDPSIQPYAYDPAKAKALLAKAGHASGFTFTLLVDNSVPEYAQWATLIQENLASVGVTMKVQLIGQAALGSVVSGKPPFKYEARTNSMSADIVDPDELVGYALQGNAGTYAISTLYNNATVNKLVVEGARTSDPAARRKLYYQAERIHHDDAPFIFLYWISNVSLASAKVQGYHPLPTGNYRLEEAWIQG